MKNNIYRNEPNEYINYYTHSENNIFCSNNERNVMNKAKESIKSFRTQFLNNNENNKIMLTEENIINQNNQRLPYQPLSEMNKAREELKDYDLYFGSGKNKNTDFDYINQENNELRKQIMELISENKNLQNKINNDNNIDYINNLNTIDNKPERDNIIKDNNNPLKDYMEESIESIIKTNAKRSSNKYKNYQSISSIDRKINSVDNKKKFKKNRLYELNYDYNDNKLNNNNHKIIINNNDNNDGQYLNVINNYNLLLESYNKNKKKLEILQRELENKKIELNKYQGLNNNYSDVQKRNKELAITVQKMKNDNIILTQHIEELSKQKKKLEKNITKLKKNSSNNNNTDTMKELLILKNKYSELQKYFDKITKEKEDRDKSEKKNKVKLNQLINENNELKNNLKTI
jgi:hypothetical protein